MTSVSKFFLTIAATVCLTAYSQSTSTDDGSRRLTVLAWNVWHEGHARTYGQQACDGTIGILRQSGADVILMVETYGTSHQVADSLGYYHRLLSSNLCIYSRYPIVKTYTFPDSISTFNFGGVEIDIDGIPVHIFDTWIHYLPDERLVPIGQSEAEILAWENSGTRDEETRSILSVLQPMIAQTDSIPIIIGGDFNSHSHLDWTEATKDLYNHGGAVVDWTVSRMMADAGFSDSFRELNPDPVKNIGTTWLTDADSLETPNRSDRIDFIYYRGATIHPVESQCYDNLLGKPFDFMGRTFFYPSDHGFVLTVFELTPGVKSRPAAK